MPPLALPQPLPKLQNRNMPCSDQDEADAHHRAAPALEIKRFQPAARRIIWWVAAAIATSAALTIACGGSDTGIEHPVAFISGSVPGALSVLNTDATVTPVSDNDATSPKWAPNHARLAFISATTDDGGRLMIWNRGENAIESVPGNFETVQRHFWAPDSVQIAFEVVSGGSSEIYVYSADGQNAPPALIAREPEGNLELGNWSGNNRWIVMRLVTGEGPGVYRRNIEGVDEVRLSSGDDFEPRYSPDGNRVAFRRRASDGSTDIYIVDANESGNAAARPAINVTNMNGDEIEFQWSPNGRHLVFVTDTDGNYEIYSLDTEDRASTRLTQNRVQDRGPDWSPSGGSILFVSDADGDYDIFSVHFESREQIRLHATDDSELVSAW